MEIMEAAAALGKTIRDSEIYREFDDARVKYESDEKLGGYLREYEADKRSIERTAELDDVDTLLVDTLQDRMKELHDLIVGDPIYTAYLAAQNKVNALMEQVNDEITYAITGNVPSKSCAHDCSGCRGCGH